MVWYIKNWQRVSNTKDLLNRIQFNPEKLDFVDEFFSTNKSLRSVLLCNNSESDSELSSFINEESNLFNRKLYIPNVDTFNNDSFNGVIKHNTNRYVIANSSEVLIDYNPEDFDVLFNYGQALYFENILNSENCNKNSMPDLKIVLMNPNEKFNDSVYSFMMGHNSGNSKMDVVLGKIWPQLNHRKKVDLILQYCESDNSIREDALPKISPESLVAFGMIYASHKPFRLMNREEVYEQTRLESMIKNDDFTLTCRPHNYNKMALMLDELYNSRK
jgi:hypothetical protein